MSLAKENQTIQTPEHCFWAYLEFSSIGVLDCVVVTGKCAGLSVKKLGVQIPARLEIWFKISAISAALANSAIMTTKHS